MVRWAAEVERRFWSPEPGERPSLAPNDMNGWVQAEPTLRTKTVVFTAATLALDEPCFNGGSTIEKDLDWEVRIDRRIRAYAEVLRLDEYWRIRERELGPAQVQAETRLFAKPTFPSEPDPVAVPDGLPAVPAPAAEAPPAPAEESAKTLKVECALHPLIAEVAVERYNVGAYGDAVRSAVQAVEHRMQTLLGSHEVGEKLISSALTGNPPKITVTRSTTPGSLESERNGMHFLFRGAVGALRNPRSHGPDAKDDRDEADEMLAFASFLMRRLDIEDAKREQAAAADAESAT